MGEEVEGTTNSYEAATGDPPLTYSHPSTTYTSTLPRSPPCRRTTPCPHHTFTLPPKASNDWNSVFNRVHNILPNSPPSYLRDHAAGNVVVYACGNSFYDTCAPDATVDLCFSSTAMHWLTMCPVQIPDALHSACTQDAAATAAFEVRGLWLVACGSWLVARVPMF